MYYFFKLIKAIFNGVELVLDGGLQFDLFALECLNTGKRLLGFYLVFIFFWVLWRIGFQLAGWVLFGENVANRGKHVLPSSGLTFML